VSFAALLNKTATVYRLTPAGQLDEYGTEKDTFQPQPETVRGRLQPVSGRERAMLGSVGVDITHYFYTSVDANIDEADELQIGSTRYYVLYVGGDSSEHHKKITLQEQRRG
jgi:SPP1 family predicted phage head-tail adaptor